MGKEKERGEKDSLSHCRDGLLAVVLAEGLAVVQSLCEHLQDRHTTHQVRGGRLEEPLRAHGPPPVSHTEPSGVPTTSSPLISAERPLCRTLHTHTRGRENFTQRQCNRTRCWRRLNQTQFELSPFPKTSSVASSSCSSPSALVAISLVASSSAENPTAHAQTRSAAAGRAHSRKEVGSWCSVFCPEFVELRDSDGVVRRGTAWFWAREGLRSSCVAGRQRGVHKTGQCSEEDGRTDRRLQVGMMCVSPAGYLASSASEPAK